LYVDGHVIDRDLEPAAIAEAVHDDAKFGWIDVSLITTNLAGTSLASEVQSVWDASATSEQAPVPGGLFLVHGVVIGYLNVLTEVVDRVDHLVETLEDRFLENESVGAQLHEARRRAGHASAAYEPS